MLVELADGGQRVALEHNRLAAALANALVHCVLCVMCVCIVCVSALFGRQETADFEQQ